MIHRSRGWLFLAASLIQLGGCAKPAAIDEAKADGKSADSFPAAAYDYFHDMDQARDTGKLTPLDLSPDEIKGRNTWVMWCGGNEAFWDWLSGHSEGFMDLLKLVSSPDRDAAVRKRSNRFQDAGMMNEPGCAPAKTADVFGLFLEPPASDEVKQPSEAIYGRSSGVVGLRLFKNPHFDKTAERRWSADRYFNDPSFYNDPQLVRPYRVGMSCGFCHVGPHPLNPPADPAAPEWANLSNNIGSQYLRARPIFGGLLKPENFIYHILDSQPPGTIDTSLIASDNINNCNTMNAIFGVPERLTRSGIDFPGLPAPAKGSANLPEQQTATILQTIPNLLHGDPKDHDNPRPVPRILLDGADAIGANGALARVYLNIGTFHQEWIRLHNPIVGMKRQEPFRIEACEANSVYWQANKTRVEYLAKFFLKSTKTMRLKDAPGGDAFLVVKDDKGVETPLEGVPWEKALAPGRAVFARRCVVCHSSKQPELFQQFAREEHDSPAGRRRWNTLLELLADPDYQSWATKAVETREFWQDNYLSTDHRVPLSVVKTNAARAFGSNAIQGHMWEDFSSITYKSLPPVKIEIFDPFAAPGHKSYDETNGGRGYYRPATLQSIWATAPYLHNNSVGIFNNDPSVKGRMRAFDDGIRKLLVRGDGPGAEQKAAEVRWSKGSDLNGSTVARLQADHGLIWRTLDETYIRIPAKSLPTLLTNVTGLEVPFLNAHPWLLPSAALALALLLLLSSSNEQWQATFGALTALALGALVLLADFVILRARIIEVLPNPADRIALLAAVIVLVYALFRYRTQKLLIFAIALLAVSAATAVAAFIKIGGLPTELDLPFEIDRGMLELSLNSLPWFVPLISFATGALLFVLAGNELALSRFGQLGLVLLFLGVIIGGYLILKRWLTWFVGPVPDYYIVPVLLLAAVVLYLLFQRPEITLRKAGYGFLTLGAILAGTSYFFAGRFGDLEIGPIPPGTPVNLFANIDPDKDDQVRAVLLQVVPLMQKAKHATTDEERRRLHHEIGARLMSVNRCKDFVMDRGHYFAAEVTPRELEDLINLLKTF